MLDQSYSSLYECASFIPPKHVDQREPKELVKELCMSQHLQDQRCKTKPLDTQVPNKYIYYR